MHCKLAGIVLDDAKLNNFAIIKADLRDAGLACMQCDTIMFAECDLSERDLTGLAWVHANLSGSKLDRANLSGVNMTGSMMVGASLLGANLARALMANFGILPGGEATRAEVTQGVVYVFANRTMTRYA